MGGSSSRSASASVIGAQMNPDVCRTMKVSNSVVAFSAAKMRSPSFSRFSSSTTTTARPAAISLMASSMVANCVIAFSHRQLHGHELLDVLGDDIDLEVDQRARFLMAQ